MTYFELTNEQATRFRQDGYLLVPALFSEEEMGLLIEASSADDTLRDHAQNREDDAGRNSKLTVWNHPGDDIFGRFARCERVVNTMERMLGDEVYHWHSKMMLKEPEVGGAWVWHQDYGYWYEYGCLYPDLASCMIAVNRATKANGCLQVLKGSHRMGRIRPERVGHQIGTDLERVEEARKRHELVYCEMEPGDGLFFHSNLNGIPMGLDLLLQHPPQLALQGGFQSPSLHAAEQGGRRRCGGCGGTTRSSAGVFQLQGQQE
jgi:hypothetical protein